MVTVREILHQHEEYLGKQVSLSGWVRTEYLEMQPGRDLPPQETMVSSSTNGYGCPAENVREKLRSFSLL